MTAFQPESASLLLKESKNALVYSKHWYFKGYEKQINHWTAVQYLSLSAIIDGSLTRPVEKDIWTIARILAENDSKESNDIINRIWAWGSLAELWLLSPLKYQTNEKESEEEDIEKALFYLKKIVRAEFDFIDELPKIGKDIIFAQESTFRQFERYISCWPEIYSSAGVIRLKSLAMEITEKAKQ